MTQALIELRGVEKSYPLKGGRSWVLRQINPSPYMYLVRHPEVVLVGSSPEPMVKLIDGRVIIGRGSVIDAVAIKKTPRSQK